MAVRFSGTQRLHRTANLPSSSAFTICGWAQSIGHSAAYEALATVAENTTSPATAVELALNSSGDLYVSSYGGGSTSGLFPAFDETQPFFWSLVLSGTGAGQARGYVRPFNRITLIPDDGGASGKSFTVAAVNVGDNGWTERLRGRVWNVKAWNRVLSPAELLIESRYARVRHPAALNFHWPLPHSGDLFDRGPYRRNPTRTGTLTTEPGTHGLLVLPPRLRYVDPGAGGGIDTTGIPSAEAFGAPAVGASIATAGISTAEALGAPTIAAGIAATGIATSEALGSHAIAAGIGATGVATAEAFGDPVVGTPGVVATGIPSAEVFGAPVVGATVAAAGVASGEAFGAASLGAGIGAAGITSEEAIGSATVGAEIAAAGVQSGEAVGQPVVGTPGIVAAGIPSAEALGVPAVAAAISANAVASGEAFGSLALGAGIVVTGIATSEAAGSPAIGAGIAGGSVASAETFGLPQIGETQIVCAGIASSEVFGLPTIGSPATTTAGSGGGSGGSSASRAKARAEEQRAIKAQNDAIIHLVVAMATTGALL